MNAGAGREVLVVTGAGGMGEAIAGRLGPGRCVVLVDASDARLEAARARLEATGHDVHAVRADVSLAADVDALAHAASALGPIRAVVHTAGVSPVQATSEEIVAVDVVGTALVLDAFEPHVGPGTVAVCVASMAGAIAEVDAATLRLLATTPTGELAGLAVLDATTMDPGAAYALAKRANHVRVEAASIRWGRRGGRVVSISPGVVATPMGAAELAGPFGDLMRSMIESSGTGRIGTPDDIAAVVEFLVSPAASFVTGTDLLVDGGAVAAVRHGAAPAGQGP